PIGGEDNRASARKPDTSKLAADIRGQARLDTAVEVVGKQVERADPRLRAIEEHRSTVGRKPGVEVAASGHTYRADLAAGAIDPGEPRLVAVRLIDDHSSTRGRENRGGRRQEVPHRL